jgi:hypothetical protein
MSTNKGIRKKSYDLSSLKGKFNTNTKYKETEYLECGQAFLEASGLPGPLIGHINMFLGHSDTGKTTALISSAVSALRKDYLPVFIITEQKWSFSHCKLMGFDCEEQPDGSWEGPFIFADGFNYIEQITDFINNLLDEQLKNGMPDGYKGFVFFWDSIGSIPCKMTYEGKGGKMQNAGVLSEKIGMGLNQRILSSRKESSLYTNTLVIINQPWVETDMTNPMSQPKIKAKGGEALWLNSTLVFRFGNEKNAGISKIDATANGRKIAYATRTKITVMKNHFNGLGYKDSRIIATPHGFIPDDKSAIDRYKLEYKLYFSEQLGTDSFELVEETSGLGALLNRVSRENNNDSEEDDND